MNDLFLVNDCFKCILYVVMLSCQQTRDSTISGCVEFAILTAVTMKSGIFWDVTPCRPVGVRRHYGGTYCPHLQGRGVSQARHYQEMHAGSRGYSKLCFAPAFGSLRAWFTVRFSETSVAFHQIAGHYVPEDSTLYFGYFWTSRYQKYIYSIENNAR
jgi:hypothetical protein